MENSRKESFSVGDTPPTNPQPCSFVFGCQLAHKFLTLVQKMSKNLQYACIRLCGQVTILIHSININIFKSMHKNMKNGGLIENNRQNEPIKLPIFGAHHQPPVECVVSHPLSN